MSLSLEMVALRDIALSQMRANESDDAIVESTLLLNGIADGGAVQWRAEVRDWLHDIWEDGVGTTPEEALADLRKRLEDR